MHVHEVTMGLAGIALIGGIFVIILARREEQVAWSVFGLTLCLTTIIPLMMSFQSYPSAWLVAWQLALVSLIAFFLAVTLYRTNTLVLVGKVGLLSLLMFVFLFINSP
jgi:hypothetical protein